MTSQKAIELEAIAWLFCRTAELLDKELKAAFDSGVQRMKKRARFANNVLPDDVRANDTRSYDAGFYKGATEQHKSIDNLPLPEWDE